MPALKKGTDEFSNVVYATVTEGGANTLTFQQLQTGYGSLERTAWIINRIEWYPGNTIFNELIANADAARLGLCTSNLITELSLQSAAVIDMLEVRLDILTSVGFAPYLNPIIRDFSSLPGGGILVLPYPLYIAIQGVSLANPLTGAVRIRFTERELADQDWVEIVQATRLLT